MPDSVRGVLLDIEGTTSSIAFVHDVLFPYSRAHLDAYLDQHWNAPETLTALNWLARDAGAPSWAAWTSGDSPADARRRVREEVRRLMDADAKSTGLKELQGLIWRTGFESGQLQSHFFPDVPAALESWAARGLDVRIYSSGSVAAQRLFFAHTERGDLSHLLRGHYDTTTGPKREASSYCRIAADMQIRPGSILFLSDVVPELDAALEAGLQTRLVVRPGNAPAPAGHQHQAIRDFGELAST